MRWHSMIMADSELIKLRRDLAREYRDEIAAGRLAGYTVFSRKRDGGDHTLFVPPAAIALFERMPSWKKRLTPYEGTPDLSRSEAVPVR